MPPEAPVRIEALLAHRAWVRALARTLVADAAQADDVEQRVWLDAIERPPAHGGALRAWFGTAVRRRARDAWRERERRGRREAGCVRPGSAPSAASVVAAADAHRRVVEAVMALDEPYRATVLLRYFEDLPPRDVAARMGVPVETVRTRTRRAIERLRADLVGGRGGGAAWIAALAVPRMDVAGGACAASGTAAAGATLGGTAGGTIATGVAGGTVMAAKAMVAVGAAGVLVGILGGGALVRGVSDGAAPDATGDAAVAPTPAETRTAETRTAERAAAADAQRASSLDRRLAQIDQRLAAQDERMAALASDVAAVLKRAEPRVPTEDEWERAARAPAAAPAADLDRLRTLSDAELLAAVRSLSSSEFGRRQIDGRGLVDASDLLLTRPLGDADRAAALECKGIGLRVLGQRDAEEAAFREALALAGPRTDQGRVISAQLAWTAAYRGEPRRAAEAFLEIAHDPDAPPKVRSWDRVHAAQQFHSAGDRERARAEYQGVVDEFGSSTDANVAGAVRTARYALQKMNAADR